MNYITLLIAIIAMFFSGFCYLQITREKKRNRILQSFIAGLIRSISDYHSKTDSVSPEDVPEKNTQLPIPYKKILEDIQYEFSKDFWMTPYEEWLKQDRLIFNDEKYGNDGFNFIYWDFFDDLFKQWHSGELLSEKDKSILDESVKITEENVGELQGEIAMYRDLLKGELDDSNFTKDDIDNRLFMMFNHIKKEHRDHLKNEILKRYKNRK
jgi:hypothetical protein